jgi:adenosylcobinamide-GDP ribazoletransferase
VSRGRASILRDGTCLAIGTLTVVPVPAPRNVGRPEAAVGMVLAAAVGALLGLTVAAIGALAGARGGPLLGGAVTVTALALLTRALHLDGLADTVDAIGSGRSRDEARAIMKRGDVGPFGGTALVLVLLLGAGSVTGLLADDWRVAVAGVVTACLLSRAAACIACTAGVPAATTTGLGAQVVGSVPRWASVGVGLAATAASVALLGWNGLALTAVVAVTTALIVRRAVVRLGGVSGDVLGAVIELGQVAALLTLLLMLG